MRVCHQYGIPHSFFSGGKHRWTPLDRDKAMAYDMVIGEECPNCHTIESDWKDADGRPLAKPVWTPVARQCPGCAELGRLKAKIPSDMQGTYTALVPFEQLGEDDDAWMDEAERRLIETEQRKRAEALNKQGLA